MTERIVIVGAGQAACELAFSLRKEGHAGSILILGDEAYPPYQRPPLSKTFLAGDVGVQSLFLRPPAAYEKAQIDLRTGTVVTQIDKSNKVLTLRDGEQIGYDKLVLATGGRARQLAVPSGIADKVMYVRGVDDVARLQPEFLPGRRLLVIGGGYVGLELAAVATARGLNVTLLETAPRLLARVASPEISAFYASLHRRHGVDIRVGTNVVSLMDGGRHSAIKAGLVDGSSIHADFAVVGIGLVPNSTLAQEAGLHVEDGIWIDAFTRTSDPNIMAIGDCANHYSMFSGRRTRIESVQNAMEQARVAAANLCGRVVPLDYIPWFWSDQYHLKLQMAGMSQGYETTITRGAIPGESFIVFYLREGRIIAADAINRPADFMHARKLIARQPSDILSLLADDTVPLKSIVSGEMSAGAFIDDGSRQSVA